MDGAQGYGVRIRQPQAAGEDWAADLALMISPIIGGDADSLEAALGDGEVVVAVGLPFDEAKQLVAVFQSLGAEAEVVDRPLEGERPPGPAAGERASPVGPGTQPFNMAGLRKALEAAARSAPPLGVPPDGDLPPLPDIDRPDGPPAESDEGRYNATRPFDPSMVRAALARVGEAPDPVDALPPVVGGDDEEADIPTAVKGPSGAPSYASGLMGIIDDEDPLGPGPTQSFGAAMYEPPPPPPSSGSIDGPPPPADRGTLAGFAAPNEQFDPAAVRRLREGGRRRSFPSGPVDLLEPPPIAEAPPRRGAAIGDKPTDRLLMPPGVDAGLGPPPPRPGELDDLPLPRLSTPDRLPSLDPPMPRNPPGRPMVVQLDAPAVDPSETGTFTREASLDPLADDDVETRQVSAVTDEELEAEMRSDVRRASSKSSRGVRPGVYQLDRERRTAGDTGRRGTPSGGVAILSTGQMVARPIARPDEEVTDSGSFRIVQREGDGQSPPRIAHSAPLAAALSLVLPGMGQVYNGQRDRGIACALSAVLVLPWLFAIVDAFRTGRMIQQGRLPVPDPKIWEKGRWGQLLLNVAVIFSVVVAYTIWIGMLGPQPAPAPAPPAAPAAPAGG